MPEFYVNMQIHCGTTIDADTEEEAISIAEGLGPTDTIEDFYHIDIIGEVTHPDDCDCPDCPVCEPEVDE